MWQDIYWTASGDSVTYKVTNGSGVEVFVGTAHLLPDEDEISVRLNDIFADSLGARAMATITWGSTKEIAEASAQDTFTVTNLNTGGTSTYLVVADYSHDADFNEVASDPILPILDRRQRAIYTILGEGVKSAQITYPDGTTSTRRLSGPVTRVDGAEIASIAIYSTRRGTIRLEAIDTCADYALYYINAYGGWDTLLMGGRCSYSEKYTRSGYKQVYDNTVRGERSKVNYINELVRTYTLRTSLLTDEQAAKMHHVLGANTAFILDLNTREQIPVTITNSSFEVKTYKGNGRKMTQYEITAEVAQDIVRR